MKAKALLGMIACAGACAVSVNVLAEDLSWFDGKVNTTTSALPTPQKATWTAPTGDGAITYSTGKITLDNGSDDPLVLTPNSSSEPVLSDGVVTIDATALLTPTDASSLEAISGAKAGFAVGIENDVKAFYGYAAGLVGNNATGWVKLVGATPPNDDTTETTFKIVLDYRAGKKNVKFLIGNTPLEDASQNTAFSIGDGVTALADVAAYGSGSISVLAATCEQKVAEYNDIGYGSIAEAVSAAGTDKSSIKVVDANGQASSGEAANGLQKWECAALGIAEDKQVGLAKSTKQNAGKITLAVQGVTVGEDLSVKYGISKDNASPTGEFDADNIQIPMDDAQGQHTYKIVPTITAAQ